MNPLRSVEAGCSSGLLPGVSAVIGEMGRSVRRHTARPARARIKASTQTDWPVNLCSLGSSLLVAAGTGRARGMALDEHPQMLYRPLGSTGEKLSLIHISEPTRLGMISYAVFCLK